MRPLGHSKLPLNHSSHTFACSCTVTHYQPEMSCAIQHAGLGIRTSSNWNVDLWPSGKVFPTGVILKTTVTPLCRHQLYLRHHRFAHCTKMQTESSLDVFVCFVVSRTPIIPHWKAQKPTSCPDTRSVYVPPLRQFHRRWLSSLFPVVSMQVSHRSWLQTLQRHHHHPCRFNEPQRQKFHYLNGVAIINIHVRDNDLTIQIFGMSTSTSANQLQCRYGFLTRRQMKFDYRHVVTAHARFDLTEFRTIRCTTFERKGWVLTV